MALTHLESEILVTNVLTLMDKRVISLPVHDALLVPRGYKSVARQVMLDTFESMGGTTPIPRLPLIENDEVVIGKSSYLLLNSSFI